MSIEYTDVHIFSFAFIYGEFLSDFFRQVLDDLIILWYNCFVSMNCWQKVEEFTMQCTKCKRDIPEDANSCPYCGVNIKGKKKMPKWLIPVIIVAVIVIAVVGGNGNKETPNSTSDDTSKGDATVVGKNTPTIDYEFEDIMTLIDEYKANEVAADNKYKDKYVKITGKVLDINKDILNSVYVNVNDGTEITWDYARCYFSDTAEIEKVAELSVGDTITIYGKVGDYDLSLSIRRCSFAE